MWLVSLVGVVMVVAWWLWFSVVVVLCSLARRYSEVVAFGDDDVGLFKIGAVCGCDGVVVVVLVRVLVCCGCCCFVCWFVFWV